jgi:hypothetical protein
MAFTRYWGKDVAELATWDSVAIPGWQEITIEETAAPLPEQIDVTSALATVYEHVEDPMGGKGLAHVTVTVQGLASKTDVSDTGFFSEDLDAEAAFVLQKGSGAGKDKFTATAKLKSRARPHEVATFVPYTVTLERNGTGTWAASTL